MGRLLIEVKQNKELKSWFLSRSIAFNTFFFFISIILFYNNNVAYGLFMAFLCGFNIYLRLITTEPIKKYNKNWPKLAKK